ncbi:hypothetical protein RQP46_000992 [Phenoliferia psychrophenolica]
MLLSLKAQGSQLDSLSSRIHDASRLAQSTTLPSKILSLSSLIDSRIEGEDDDARRILDAFGRVESELDDLAHLAGSIKLSLALRRTPVDEIKAQVLEDTIAEFTRAVDSAHAMLDSQLKYHTTRAGLSSALLQSPSVQDYVLAIDALDRKAFRTARQHLTDTRDVYL